MILDDDELEKEKLKNKKLRKIIIIAIIILSVLVVIVGGLIYYKMQHPSYITTYIDGNLVQDLNSKDVVKSLFNDFFNTRLFINN